MLIEVHLIDPQFQTGNNGSTGSPHGGHAKRVPPLTAWIDPAKVKCIVPFDYLRGLPPQIGGIGFPPLMTGMQLIMDDNNQIFIEENQPPGVMDALRGNREKNALHL